MTDRLQAGAIDALTSADVAKDELDLVSLDRVAVVLLVDGDRLLELRAPACKAAGEYAEHADLHGLGGGRTGHGEQDARDRQANQTTMHCWFPP